MKDAAHAATFRDLVERRRVVEEEGPVRTDLGRVKSKLKAGDILLVCMKKREEMNISARRARLSVPTPCAFTARDSLLIKILLRPCRAVGTAEMSSILG
ncbi:MAG: hypothetical protein HIU93_11160 [Acidobacteria bacterium]|nr:hypothetical protein [Acidobacteriota bacterium]